MTKRPATAHESLHTQLLLTGGRYGLSTFQNANASTQVISAYSDQKNEQPDSQTMTNPHNDLCALP